MTNCRKHGGHKDGIASKKTEWPVESLENTIVPNRKTFQLYQFENGKLHPVCNAPQADAFEPERFSSKNWQKTTGIGYVILYPDKNSRESLERIPHQDIQTKTCEQLSTRYGLPAQLVIDYKAFLHRLPKWTRWELSSSGKSTMNFDCMRETCLHSCHQRKMGKIKGCVLYEGY